MVLFKPFMGSRVSLDAQEKHAGYAYFCTDDGSFHIDYIDANGVLQRKQLNAKEAEILLGEQSKKIDTAIQSITSDTDSGIKTMTNGTTVTIDLDLDYIINELDRNIITGVRVFSTTPFYINDVEYIQTKENPVGLYSFNNNSILTIKDATNTMSIATIRALENTVLPIAIPNSYHTAGSDNVPVFDNEVVSACIEYDVHTKCLPLGSQIVFNNNYITHDVDNFSSISSYSIGSQSQTPRVTDPNALWENMSCEHHSMFNGANIYLILRGSDY